MAKHKGSNPVQRKNLDPESELEYLTEKLRVLETLPRDFRDIPPNSVEWRDYKEYIPQSAEAMEQWLSGSIVVIGRSLTPIEKQALERNHKTVMYLECEPNSFEFSAMCLAMQNAEASGASFIYLKGFPQEISRAVNWFASFFKLHVRAKHEFVEGHPKSLVNHMNQNQEE